MLCDGVDFDNERNDHRVEILLVKDELLIVTGTAGCHDYASPTVIHWTMRPWTMYPDPDPHTAGLGCECYCVCVCVCVCVIVHVHNRQM